MTQKYALFVVLAILFVDIAGEGISFPITPGLLKNLSGGSEQDAARLYGIALAVYAGLTLFFTPVLGVLSDRFGRKPILLISMLGAAIGNLLTALAPNLEVFFLGRIIAGATSANMVVINAYLIDSVEPEQRAKYFGFMGAIFGMGFVVGPALGGFMGNLGLCTPFFVVAGLSAFAFLAALALVSESLKPENRRRVSWREANPFGALAALGKYPVVRALAWTVLLNQLALQMLIAVWVPSATYRYGFGTTENGLTLAAFGLSSALAQGLLVPYLVPKLGERRSIIFGLIISVATYILYGLAPTGWALVAILVITALGAIDEPALQALISRNTKEDEQGTIQSGLATIGSLMGVVGPLVGTFIFGHFTGPGATAEIPGATFFAGALCVFVGLGLAYRTLRV
jgi:MFS transporter, DHA1 family, tetracycline resistance protein